VNDLRYPRRSKNERLWNDRLVAKVRQRVKGTRIRRGKKQGATASAKQTSLSNSENVLSRLIPALRLKSDASTRRKLSKLVHATAWVDSFANEIGTNERRSKQWPHRHLSDEELRTLTRAGDDGAFFELVAREPGYLFTAAARARIHLWHLQKRRVLDGRSNSDEGATANLTRLGKALARGSRADPHQARSFFATYESARVDVTSAATEYARKRYAKPSADALAKTSNISAEAALRIATSKRSPSAIETAIDIEVSARLGIGTERVRQLKRELERDGIYYVDPELD
jgi:hypothetical protein